MPPFTLPSRGDPRRESVQFLYLYYMGDFQGLSDKLLFKNHWDLEVSQTFLDRSLLKIFCVKISEEDDFLDLWPDILGFPDYICSLISK